MEVERYSDPQSFAREVNLPLLGAVHVAPVPAGAPAATLLAADNPDEMKPVIELLTQTRKSLTLRSLFLTGFPHDPEFFAAGLALARQWSRQGLKIAVVDLDYRHPTVVRPRPEPNEGLVDALEYGCSFQRIAWELVSDALWLVGPGSHPPDEQRFPDHPDWTRVMRIFTGRVDMVIYLAPFLDRKGFTGALSKRMDGVVFCSCVRRQSRAALRDAFLELWGSDAPMIGCIGIDAPFDPTPHGETVLHGDTNWAPEVRPSPAPTPSPAPAPKPAMPGDWSFIAPDEGQPYSGPDRRSASREAPPPKPSAPSTSVKAKRDPGDAATKELVARLTDEVRRGQVTRPAPKNRGLLLVAVALLLAGVAAFATFQAMRKNTSRASLPAETLPAGTEPVLPADLGTPAAGIPTSLPDQGGSTEAPAPTVPSITTEDAAPAPPPEPTPKNYEVHVASFNSDKQAKNLVKRLHDRGLTAWYAKATDQPNWYRVFVGHYTTHAEAARQARSLLDRGLVEHAIAYPDHAR